MTVLTPDEAFRKAYAYYAKGDLANAEKICRAVLRAAPGYGDATYLLAIIANRNGSFGEGELLLRQAVENRGYTIVLEGNPPSVPRHTTVPHIRMETLLLRDIGRYIELMRSFESYLPQLREIANATNDSGSPYWNNPWIPAFDAITLYCMIALKQPKQYVEVGSGNSTKFVRRAIMDHGLATTIVSIDPQPRAEIDSLCDISIRKPLEDTDLTLFSDLGAGDMVFVDSSHRCFTNSDVTVLFTEVFPSLPSGVMLGMHDIFLPYDYPAEWVARYYSEQYLLATYLLAGSDRCDILLPGYFVTRHAQAREVLASFRHGLPLASPMEGTSFWIAMK